MVNLGTDNRNCETVYGNTCSIALLALFPGSHCACGEEKYRGEGGGGGGGVGWGTRLLLYHSIKLLIRS